MDYINNVLVSALLGYPIFALEWQIAKSFCFEFVDFAVYGTRGFMGNISVLYSQEFLAFNRQFISNPIYFL
ncbi:hypothetical protein NG796_04535 [Laspinema sp. A4]|uniref:hypothetical protein n=1 Tax=Laspinema sp. D2d TaxID=2953686 RepID=UPI0021BB3368|nr:hypothetical protein [Laspinema sp. D2d]MCT7982554.1 hypothetical protein [Laspinema sp. D2d]